MKQSILFEIDEDISFKLLEVESEKGILKMIHLGSGTHSPKPKLIIPGIEQLYKTISTEKRAELNALIENLEKNNPDKLVGHDDIIVQARTVADGHAIYIDKIIYYYLKYSFNPPDAKQDFAPAVNQFLQAVNSLDASIELKTGIALVKRNAELKFKDIVTDTTTVNIIRSTIPLQGYVDVIHLSALKDEELRNSEKQLRKISPRAPEYALQQQKVTKLRMVVEKLNKISLKSLKYQSHEGASIEHVPLYVKLTESKEELLQAKAELPHLLNNYQAPENKASLEQGAWFANEKTSSSTIINSSSHQAKPKEVIDVWGAVGHFLKVMLGIPSRWRQGSENNLAGDIRISPNKSKGYFENLFDAGKLLTHEISKYFNKTKPSSQAKILASSIGKDRNTEFYQGPDELPKPKISLQTERQVEVEKVSEMVNNNEDENTNNLTFR